ncbi:NAD-dependent epimerase/dehydratase family protein [Nocardioides montaniterrae]
MIGVFGARGFLGQAVTRQLAEAGHEVLAAAREFDTDTTFDGFSGVRTAEVDFRDLHAVRRLLPGIDTVVQLIGTTSPATSGKWVAGEFQEHVIPQAAFLDECVDNGVRRVVFASSGGTVYGPGAGEDGPIHEGQTTNPISSHGISKLMIEKALALHGEVNGLEHVSLRIANAYGPGQHLKHGQGLIPALIEHHSVGRPVTIFGDGSATRDYVYVSDVTAAFQAAVELDGAPRTTLNVGTGVATSVMDLVRGIEEISGIRFDLDFKPARETDVRSNVLDVSRAAEVLDWKPVVELHEGLTQTLRWHGIA